MTTEDDIKQIIDEIQILQKVSVEHTGRITELEKQIAPPEKDMDRDDGMPCFDCEAVFDDQKCYNKRNSIDEYGIKGMDCPRIKKMIEEARA